MYESTSVPIESTRQKVIEQAKWGVMILIAAFNADDDASADYRFSKTARAKVIDLVTEIAGIAKFGAIEIKPIGIARADTKFQAMLTTVIAKPKRAAKKGAGHAA